MGRQDVLAQTRYADRRTSLTTVQNEFFVMSKTIAIVITQNEDGSFHVLDAAGCAHEVGDELELGHLCAELIHDPTLPEFDTVDLQTNELEKVATKVAEKMLPDALSFVAAPAVKALRGAVQKLDAHSKRASKIRSTEESKAKAKKRRARKKSATKKSSKGPRLRSLRY